MLKQANPKSIEPPLALQQQGSNGCSTLDSLYVHVPFCFHKCHYCDFYSLAEDPAGPSRQALFTRRLLSELEHRATQVRLQPRTLFVGGGTPTLLQSDYWQQLLIGMRELAILDRIEEFTVEANPETVTPELIDLLKANGVNRMSLGAQSFNRAHLKTLERWHEPDNVARAVRIIQQAGIDNINLDLIFAIPGQQLIDLQHDLDAVLAIDPEHISCYGLTYEPNTALTRKLKLGRISPVEESLERDMYALAIEQLDRAGFDHYEISAWARRGSHNRRCQHNLIYWTNGNWLGVGPAAASHLDGWRWKNKPNLTAYIEHEPEPPFVDQEQLPPAARVGEQLMMHLRLREGVPLAWLETNLPAADPRWQTIADLQQIHMLERNATHLRLTSQGLFVADAVIAKLL